MPEPFEFQSIVYYIHFIGIAMFPGEFLGGWMYYVYHLVRIYQWNANDFILYIKFMLLINFDFMLLKYTIISMVTTKGKGGRKSNVSLCGYQLYNNFPPHINTIATRIMIEIKM
jgi:hypothetical protein